MNKASKQRLLQRLLGWYANYNCWTNKDLNLRRRLNNMEYKTKTIMWEDNNEPPKNYIWAKPDGKFYEYSYVTRNWVESKLIKTEESGGSGGSDSGGDSGGSADINTILDNISIKDDLLTKLRAIDYTNEGVDGVLTDLTFDDVFNDYNDFIKQYLYRIEFPVISAIEFSRYIVLEHAPNFTAMRFTISDDSYNSYAVTVGTNPSNDIEIYVLHISNQPI